MDEDYEEDGLYIPSLMTDKPGLLNSQNDCYLNSVLQCLANFSVLRNYFLAAVASSPREIRTGEVSLEFTKILQLMDSVLSFPPSPVPLKNAIEKYSGRHFGNGQQDAHEFLGVLMDSLHREIRTGPTENDSFIGKTFGGRRKSTLICQFCGFENSKLETFFELTLQIPAAKFYVSLEDCLIAYLNPELVTWKCPRCKEDRETCKKFDILIFPDILIVHFSRFTGTIEKNESFVGFEFELDTRPFNGSDRFQLYGVCNHSGDLSRGHYTAFIHNSEKWYRANDSLVVEMDYREVVTSSAYILFYQIVK